jgi:thiosulfate dehydrogenase (quinone) large subunit
MDAMSRRQGVALLIARLFAGGWFLMTGTGKLTRGFLAGGALLPQLERMAAGTPHAWYKAWLVGVVIPHEHVFAVLTALGETLVGIGLVLGALTEYAARAGIFMVSNYLFGKGWPNPTSSLDKTFIALLLVILIGGAGNFLGFDDWRRRR